jgi:hypothetical protein
VFRNPVFVPESRQVANELRAHQDAGSHEKTPTLPLETLYTFAQFLASCEASAFSLQFSAFMPMCRANQQSTGTGTMGTMAAPARASSPVRDHRCVFRNSSRNARLANRLAD